MWLEIKAAARDGLILGVKLGTALAIVGVVLTWALGDYFTVRQRALHGQQAYEYLQRQQAARAAPQKGP